MTISLEKSKNFNKAYFLTRQIPIFTSVITFALYSPLISFYMGIFFLLACSRYIERKRVKWIGYVCAYSGSVMIASRNTFGKSDDFNHYYKSYINILNDGWSAVFDTLYGTELGLPIYYFVLSGFGITNQVFPLFAVSMLSSALFVLWLDMFGSSYFPSGRYGTMMAISLLFYSFLSATQTTRQMISLSFLLFAISTVGWRSLVWLVCALLFHQTSIVMYLMFKSVKRFGWISLIFVLGFGLGFMFFFNRVMAISLLTDSNAIRVASKFAYYTFNDASNTNADMSGLKFVSICCVAALLSAKYMPERWGLLILCVGILYVLFLPHPLLSLRTFMIFVAVLAGYITSFLAFRVGWSVISWLAVVYSIYTLVKQFSLGESYAFQLWEKFDWIGYIPFYYFIDQ